MSKAKANVQKIAKLANVSPGTVSNALNDRPGVSEATKQKILKIADDLGYERKHLPASANQGIRIIMYKRTGHIVSDTPFFANLIEGMQKECRETNYEMLITHITKGSESDQQVKELKYDTAAGYLVLATEMLEEDFALFQTIGKPIVFLDSYFPRQQGDFVVINNLDGAYQATQHLIDNGHKNIGYLYSTTYINNFFYRKQGFMNAMEDHGLTINQNFWLKVKPTLDGAYQDVKQYLAKNKRTLPTAFFADNDIIAFGALSAFKESGIKIPQEISIIGFDDMPYCEISEPKLSTVRVHKKLFGAVAIRRLIDMIQRGSQVKQKIEISTELVVRNSVQNLF